MNERENKRTMPTRSIMPLYDAEIGKLPPQAIDLEEAVLGALMLEKDALIQVEDILRPQSFYSEKHQLIYKSIQILSDQSQNIDILTVAEQLQRTGELEAAGGRFYIAELTTRINSAAHIEAHARIISEMAIKRELINVSSLLQRDAYDHSTDALELLDFAEKKLFDVSENNIRQKYADMSTLVLKAIDELKSKKLTDGGITGVPSGLASVDKHTSGWQPSDLIVLGARPGMGKTAFALSILRNAAVDHKKPVAVFSLEMSNLQLVNRLFSGEAEIPSDKIRKGNLTESEWGNLISKLNALSEAPIYIDDTPSISITELRAKCRRLKAKHNIEMVVIDYLQLITTDSVSRGKNSNREQEVAYISRSLKALAKELNIPIMVLSQLSRKTDDRGKDKTPQLSDLRESGAIEQDADIVMFLYRQEYYKLGASDQGVEELPEGETELIIAKFRNGSPDTIKIKFLNDYVKFVDANASDFRVSSFDGLGSFEGESKHQAGTITLGSRSNSLGTNEHRNSGNTNINHLIDPDDELPY